MIVDNGEQLRLLVPGVFDGVAGVARERLWFVPNMDRADPARAIVGVLNDQAVRIAPVKDATGPGWTLHVQGDEVSIDDMRAALGLGPEVSDADVVAAWDVYLASLPPAPTTATPTELKQRYPAFAGVSTDTISYWLTDALYTVNEGWGADANRAQMALAAHNMAVNAVPGIAKTEAENLPAGVTRFRSASMDVAVSESAANRSIATGYGSTRYGEEFRVFLRRHTGGPRLVGCA